jgi:CHAT domain-containing protein
VGNINSLLVKLREDTHGERPAAALRTAQVDMWKQKQWQSPYWAAFTMQGEWR